MVRGLCKRKGGVMALSAIERSWKGSLLRETAGRTVAVVTIRGETFTGFCGGVVSERGTLRFLGGREFPLAEIRDFGIVEPEPEQKPSSRPDTSSKEWRLRFDRVRGAYVGPIEKPRSKVRSTKCRHGFVLYYSGGMLPAPKCGLCLEEDGEDPYHVVPFRMKVR
jgi:hypothetical protein